MSWQALNEGATMAEFLRQIFFFKKAVSEKRPIIFKIGYDYRVFFLVLK